MRDHAKSDAATRARTILDDNRFAEYVPECLAYDPRNQISRPAGRKGIDQGDLPRWKIRGVFRRTRSVEGERDRQSRDTSSLADETRQPSHAQPISHKINLPDCGAYCKKRT
jgi:hypothetical protein